MFHLTQFSRLSLFLLCFCAMIVFGGQTLAQRNNAGVSNKTALKETTRISNLNGSKLIADFYASSGLESVALSPPSMFSTFSAAAHIAKGKTQKELQTLLFLNGKESPAFAELNSYLSRQKEESGEVFGTNGYFSRGYFLVNNAVCTQDISSNVKNEIYEKFATTFQLTDFSETDAAKINKEISQITNGKFDQVIDANSGQPAVICTAMNLESYWSSSWNMTGGDVLPFKFDIGRVEIDFLKGNAHGYQRVRVNNKSGYRFQISDTMDMTLVPCRNGADLRQLAKTISKEGYQLQPGRRVRRQTGLYMPAVDFETDFDFKEYAIAKGFKKPFTVAEAEFDLPGAKDDPFCIGQAYSRSKFSVDQSKIELVQVTVVAVETSAPPGEEPQIPQNIVIDTPYLMVLTERNLDAILGMAFIANPGVYFEPEEGSVESP